MLSIAVACTYSKTYVAGKTTWVTSQIATPNHVVANCDHLRNLKFSPIFRLFLLSMTKRSCSFLNA
jgi:hypothetical protein